ncbi:YmfQ family protein [Chromobacterium violaceum]|uniref:Phage tail protein n=1 Tax=Chromobacterium violaceum TaxID=536 RepID=A0A202B2B7_CHRVL|nr:putative phage tail protein [Chromobacterium violaceum]OVE45578.1 phage tail protein [Chromobacterium violaceum]
MSLPNYTALDYQGALQRLLPRGRVWPRDPDAVQSKVAAALAQVYGRTHDRANNLLVDSFPAQTFELLPEWEATLGLPDPALGLASTVTGRRQQVVAKLTATGGQSAAYYQSVAAGLGFTISVTNYAPFRCGQSASGQPVGSADWHHTWSITAATNTINHFAAGASASGEPLSVWGNSILQNVLQRIAPAHSVLQFRYSS